MKIGRISIDVSLLPSSHYYASLMGHRLYERTHYPPRVVHEVNLVLFTITVVDSRRLNDVTVPAGLMLVPPGENVLPGDLVWDSDRGRWNPAAKAHIGTPAGNWLGIARKTN